MVKPRAGLQTGVSPLGLTEPTPPGKPWPGVSAELEDTATLVAPAAAGMTTTIPVLLSVIQTLYEPTPLTAVQVKVGWSVVRIAPAAGLLATGAVSGALLEAWLRRGGPNSEVLL